MQLTLESTTTRLADLVRRDLEGAELLEFRQVADDGAENAYVVRWTAERPAFVEHGTHRAALHADGRSLLMWGHYARDLDDAKDDYKERS